MKYTAINIGPIVSTLGMARKPRELWAASYLFSCLMKHIIEALPDKSIISPSIKLDVDKNGIGLYPDRVYVKDAEISYDEAIRPVVARFANDMGLDASYFNVMMTSGDYEKDSLAIRELNKKLDLLELFNMTKSSFSSDRIRALITKTDNSPLFEDAFDDGKNEVDSLGEIAALSIERMCVDEQWTKFVNALKSDKREVKEKAYNYLPKDKLKSYHKYICVVKADGDNVGKTVSNPKLKNDNLREINDALLSFGSEANNAIKEYGGMPIYIGGDDLLFIAPVVGKNSTNIFDLLKKLNDDSFSQVKAIVNNLKDDEGKEIGIKASLSFGVSITYYKYPLYEALDAADKLLQKAKENKNEKNKIVVKLRKHSGGSFSLELLNSNKELSEVFTGMIETSAVEESVVSAISHKIRENEGIFKLWEEDGTSSQRNVNFFKHYLEYDSDKDKESASDLYKKAALGLFNALFASKNKVDIKQLIQTMYAMLRLAKFVNGEEVRDE